MDYHDGKYGVNTDPERGADTFIPFRSESIDILGNFLTWNNSYVHMLTATKNYEHLYVIGSSASSFKVNDAIYTPTILSEKMTYCTLFELANIKKGDVIYGRGTASSGYSFNAILLAIE